MRFAHFAYVWGRPQSPHQRYEIALRESHQPAHPCNLWLASVVVATK